MDDFNCTKNQYIYNSQLSTISTFAIIKDGVWYEQGKMGWFGMSLDNKDKKEWDEDVKAIIDSLPEDTLLSVFDCHI